jgi:hypothetical protein
MFMRGLSCTPCSMVIFFQMGPKLLTWLADYILQSNLSVHAFVKGVRFALLQFFSSQAASSLCASPSNDEHWARVARTDVPACPPDHDATLWKATWEALGLHSDQVRARVAVMCSARELPPPTPFPAPPPLPQRSSTHPNLTLL